MLLGRLRYGRSSRAEVCQDADMDRLEGLLVEVADCTLCSSALPLGPRPIVQASARARVLVAGQAPGRKVHESGVAWNDASGVRLREWMGISEEVFYDPARVALLPMGFCYPGTGPSGDLPPRPECAPDNPQAPDDLSIHTQLGCFSHFPVVAYYAPWDSLSMGSWILVPLEETISSFGSYL